MSRRYFWSIVLFFVLVPLLAFGEGKVVRVYRGALNVNTASAADFSRLPGIGDVISWRIVKEREDRGGYHDLKELKRVKGVSERVWGGIRNYLSLKGDNTLTVQMDLNTVTKSLLLGLPGASAVEARSILNYRADRGRIREVEELHRVPGVTAKRYDELAVWLTVAR